jgi:GDP-L-fucose synthase
MKRNTRIYVAGHRGLVGSAILHVLEKEGYSNIITCRHNQLDIENQAAVNDFFERERPEYVFLAAAKVGGIGANSTYPADFIYENTMIGFNIIHASYKYQVKKLMNLGSSCIYPQLAMQPLREESLLTGPLEPTNDAYALAKISAIKLCSAYNKQYRTNFLSVMPTNLYGPGDNYDLETSHVLPAMIRKFHEAKVSGSDTVVLWGDGSPLREFLYSLDLAEMVVSLMQNYDAADLRNDAGDFINVGSGSELSIKELAKTVRQVVYKDCKSVCDIAWDKTKPNGTPRKLCDITRLKSLGYSAKTSLFSGIQNAYADFLNNQNG